MLCNDNIAILMETKATDIFLEKFIADIYYSLDVTTVNKLETEFEWVLGEQLNDQYKVALYDI